MTVPQTHRRPERPRGALAGPRASAFGGATANGATFDAEDGLRRFGGKLDLYSELLTTSRQRWIAAAKELAMALGERDHGRAVRAIRSARDVAANLGARRLATAAATAEAELQLPRTNARTAVLDQFDGALTNAIEAVDVWLKAQS